MNLKIIYLFIFLTYLLATGMADNTNYEWHVKARHGRSDIAMQFMAEEKCEGRVNSIECNKKDCKYLCCQKVERQIKKNMQMIQPNLKVITKEKEVNNYKTIVIIFCSILGFFV